MELDATVGFNDGDCQRERFGDDLVILNFKSGRYLSVTGSGSDIVDLLTSGIAPSRLLGFVSGSYPDYLAATQSFISSLIENEIMVPGAAKPGSPAFELILNTAPAVQVFEDMADLIKSDPIHDADDLMGWPVQKQNT